MQNMLLNKDIDGNIMTWFTAKTCTSIITKFRLSSHKLNIERGRYSRPKVAREERICKFCNEVESESHVYYVLLYFVCHVCFAMYDINDVVFSISNKE